MSARHPSTRTGTDTVELHGEVIPDSFRWLEDTYSAETQEWIGAQNGYTQSFLTQFSTREAIRQQLTDRWDFPKVGVPRRHGKRWFQWRNAGLQNQPVLFLLTSPTDEGRVLIDPNTLSADGTVAVSWFSFSDDGALFAYALSEAGSDWNTWRVRDVETGEDLPDLVEWSKFSTATWLKDGSGFYYGAYAIPGEGRQFLDNNGGVRVCLHRIGTAQSEDQLVYERPEAPDMMLSPYVTDDGRYLVISAGVGAAPETELHVLDLEEEGAEFRTLVGDLESGNYVVGNDGTDFFVLTDSGAPLRRIVRVSLDSPRRESWVDVVPEDEHQLVAGGPADGNFVCHYMVHASSVLRVISPTGTRLHDVAIPRYCSLLEMSGHHDDPVVYFTTTSFTDPGTVWQHDTSTNETLQLFVSPGRLSEDDFVTEQHFFESLDGTTIPAYLVHRKDVHPTGDVPVFMTGYGGFNIPMPPAYQPARAVWVERGGLFVYVTLRGGGEYGLDWYHAGRLHNKQNVFDDFCSAARWLHTSGWSKPSRIAINGGSNGGLLVGACITQHPELFGAAIPEVGVLDLLRFHQFTIGRAWIGDYGNPDDAEAFAWLRTWSPLHNVRPGTSYPATMVMTGDHDDRVVPGHSFKFGAALQAAQAGDAPVLVRVETSTGHGMGKPTALVIESRADVLAFAEWALGGIKEG